MRHWYQMSQFQRHEPALRLWCVCFHSRVSFKQANAVQLVPLPMAFAALTAIYRSHKEPLDKQAMNTNKISLTLPKQFGKCPIPPPHS